MHIMITGASSGIGRELAKLLDSAGHDLSVCGRSEAKLNVTLEALKGVDRHFAQSFCVTDASSREDFVLGAETKLGGVDALINCAGLNSVRAQGHELPLASLDAMMQVNCYASIAMMQLVVPKMMDVGQGMLVNVLSTVCDFANENIAGYTTSKAALDAYCKVMRKELRTKGVKVLSIYPGGVDTDFRDAARPEYLHAEDVARAIVPMLETAKNAHIHELVIRPSCETNFS